MPDIPVSPDVDKFLQSNPLDSTIPTLLDEVLVYDQSDSNRIKRGNALELAALQSAADMFYNNLLSGLISVSVQDAIDEVAAQAIYLKSRTDINDTKISATTANVDAAGAVMESDATTANMSFVINDDTFVTASDTTLATSDSIKQFVLAQVASQVTYEGSYDASAAGPNSSASAGSMYTATVAGTGGGFWSSALEIGDVIIAEQDNPATENDWTVVNKNLDAGSIKASYESNADTNAFTNSLLADLNANTAARHTHANQGILDATTASFTTADETKLDGLVSADGSINTHNDVNALGIGGYEATGTWSPDITGVTFVETGTYNSAPAYTATDAFGPGQDAYLWWDTTAWNITDALGGMTSYWAIGGIDVNAPDYNSWSNMFGYSSVDTTIVASGALPNGGEALVFNAVDSEWQAKALEEADISNLHTHANKASLDLVSGTNTGDQDLNSVTTNGATTTNDISTGKITTGNNTAVGANATAIGGINNAASGVSSEVLGGDGSTASGQGSTVVGGSGHNNSGNWSTSVGGLNQTITSVRGGILGGFDNTLQHNDSTMVNCVNRTSVATNTLHTENLHLFGGVTMPTGATANYVLTSDSNGVGTWQAAAGGGGQVDSVVAGTNVTIDNTDPINPIISAAGGGGGTTLSGTTANDTQTEIYVDGTPTNRVDVATGSTITFSALVAARSATESAGYKIEGVIKNDAGTAEIVGVVVKTIFAEEDIAWDATVTAANNAITFLVTGDSVDSVSWEVTLNKIEAT